MTFIMFISLFFANIQTIIFLKNEDILWFINTHASLFLISVADI